MIKICNQEIIEVKLHGTGRTLHANDVGHTSGVHARVVIAMTAIFLSLVTLFRSLTSLASGELSKAPQLLEHDVAEMVPDETPKEEFHPPSPTPDLCQADVISSIMWRLTELEEKVGSLSSKPLQMPFDKEELLNAAVCRVDALEAELIATKKVFSKRRNFIHNHLFSWVAVQILHPTFSFFSCQFPSSVEQQNIPSHPKDRKTTL